MAVKEGLDVRVQALGRLGFMAYKHCRRQQLLTAHEENGSTLIPEPQPYTFDPPVNHASTPLGP